MVQVDYSDFPTSQCLDAPRGFAFFTTHRAHDAFINDIQPRARNETFPGQVEARMLLGQNTGKQRDTKNQEISSQLQHLPSPPPRSSPSVSPKSCVRSSHSPFRRSRYEQRQEGNEVNYANDYQVIYTRKFFGSILVHVSHQDKINFLLSRIIENTISPEVVVRPVLPRGYMYLILVRILSNPKLTILPSIEGNERLLILVSTTAIIGEAMYRALLSGIKTGIGEGILKIDSDIATWKNGDGKHRMLRTNWARNLEIKKAEE